MSKKESMTCLLKNIRRSSTVFVLTTIGSQFFPLYVTRKKKKKKKKTHEDAVGTLTISGQSSFLNSHEKALARADLRESETPDFLGWLAGAQIVSLMLMSPTLVTRTYSRELPAARRSRPQNKFW